MEQVLTKEAKRFKRQVKIQMELMGASDYEIKMLTDEIIINAMSQGREPKDVAWAILQ